MDCRSPNHDARPDGIAIDALVLHYTGMTSGQAALDRLTDPVAKVSAHYLVEEDGTVFSLVQEARRAWHAGISNWGGRQRLNDNSIGIEIVNPGHQWGLKPFPEVQIDAVIELCQGILARHPIPAARVLAHSDIAPTRKLDPGELFPWAQFAEAGIGLWPASRGNRRLGHRPPIIQAQRMLREWGYGVDETGVLDVQTATVIAAFQRRCRPARVDGVFDAECGDLLGALLESSA
jgi:N-acetylmuramoyl-L-alanine amidase